MANKLSLTIQRIYGCCFFSHRAGVYEEEDFQPGLYGYGVCAEVPEPRAAAAVREVEEELQRVVKSSRSRQGEPWEPLMQKQVSNSYMTLMCHLLRRKLVFIHL